MKCRRFNFFLLIVVLLSNSFTMSAQKSEIRRLFQSKDSAIQKKFDYDQLKDLPKPVGGYFRHVLPDGLPYVRTVRLKHDGQFRLYPNEKWMDIKGEQYFISGIPGFLWVGKTSLFTARDMYIDDRGKLIVKLFSILRIAKSEGKEVDQAELLRWLGESVWFPTNLLPSENLRWEAIDSLHAKLLFSYKDQDLEYIVTFNNDYEIVRLETERYYTTDKLKPWIGKLGNYQKNNGMLVPMDIEASWKFDEQEYTYADFRVTQIEFDVAEGF